MVIVIFFVSLVVSQQALAYIDPGVGSLLIQMILAVVGAIGSALVFFRSQMARLINRFTWRSKNHSSSDSQQDRSIPRDSDQDEVQVDVKQ